MIARAILAGTLLLSAADARPRNRDTITLEEARALSVPALARRVLGLTGAGIREVRIVSGEDVGRPGTLSTLYLARAPRRAGKPGLCEAYVFIINFEPAGPRRANGQTPVAATQVWRNSWHKVVDALEWPRPFGLAELARADARCAAATPVLWPPQPSRERGYFSGSIGGRYHFSADEAWFAARTLTAAIAWPGRMDCRGAGDRPVPWLCTDPRKLLAGRKLWEDGFGVEILNCRDQPQTYCVTVGFPADPAGPSPRSVWITVATASTEFGHRDPIIIRSVALEGSDREG